jgi:hypothetical protein
MLGGKYSKTKISEDDFYIASITMIVTLIAWKKFEKDLTSLLVVFF